MGLSYEHRVKEAKSRCFSPYMTAWYQCFYTGTFFFFFVNFPLFHVYLVYEREFGHVCLVI